MRQVRHDHADICDYESAIARVADDAVRAGGYEFVVPTDAEVEREEAAERVEAVHAQQPAEDGQREADSGQGRERKVHVVLSVRYVQQRKHFKGEGVRRILVCQDECTLRQTKSAVDKLWILSRVRSGWPISERCDDLPSPLYFRSAKTSPGIFRCPLHIHRGKAGAWVVSRTYQTHKSPR